MRATALGTSAAYPGPNDACSGWLVEADDTKVLIDCGTGILSRLQALLNPDDLTAVIISHVHADHWLDLIPLRYAFRYALTDRQPPALYLPPRGHQTMLDVVRPLGDGPRADFFSAVFPVQEYDPDKTLSIGNMRLDFTPGTHYIPSWAIAVRTDKRFVYTADTAPSREVADLARGADLLVAEATYLSLAEEAGDRRGHMTAGEAGQLAAYAQAKRTLLTHIWPNRDRRLTLEQAKQAYRGEMAMAETGASYEL